MQLLIVRGMRSIRDCLLKEENLSQEEKQEKLGDVSRTLTRTFSVRSDAGRGPRHERSLNKPSR